MGKIEKAEKFYLRGFNSQYVKRRLGISHQSLLNTLANKGVSYDKDDIIRYQIDYISQLYTRSEIEAAYCDMMARYDDPYKTSRRRQVVMLGCGFGDFNRVMKALLGLDVYKELQKIYNKNTQHNKITK